MRERLLKTNNREHLKYFPYDEMWVQNKATSAQESTPYKFTGKEQDEETGWYYYGARYYDARLSRWISADPALIKYLPEGIDDFDDEHDYYYKNLHDNSSKLKGMGGVYNSINLDLYHYAGQNPVKLVDPDGEAAVLGAIGGAAGGAALEVLTQATANILSGKDAFEDLDLSDIAVSTLLGGGAGASGFGGIKLGKVAYSAYKKYKVANASLKARNIAIVAGKVRNAEKTAKVGKIVNAGKKEMGKAFLKGAASTSVKNTVKKGVNVIQEQNKKDKK